MIFCLLQQEKIHGYLLTETVQLFIVKADTFRFMPFDFRQPETRNVAEHQKKSANHFLMRE